MTDYERSFSNPEYAAWRAAVFERDNGKCRICGAKGEEVHHILGWTKAPSKRFTIENGITLCKNCHKRTDNYHIPKNKWTGLRKYNSARPKYSAKEEKTPINIDDTPEYTVAKANYVGKSDNPASKVRHSIGILLTIVSISLIILCFTGIVVIGSVWFFVGLILAVLASWLSTHLLN